VSRNPRVDAYIAKAQPFARPILERVRELVHANVPKIEEAIKWGHPAYIKEGKILLGTAAFKEHAAVRFWRGEELGLEVKGGGMGQLGKLTHVKDLPQDLEAMIRKAAQLSNTPQPASPSRGQKPMPELHPDFASALENSPAARSVFDGFAPSHRREYVEWIAEAKQEATRQKRIATAIEWISEGKRRNWKYENC
jgi:uncharacterized protein YdeI (YjbR/CyaY-like superfamily)